MSRIQWPGKTPLDYIKDLIWYNTTALDPTSMCPSNSSLDMHDLPDSDGDGPDKTPDNCKFYWPL
jgi:hypothetical protein